MKLRRRGIPSWLAGAVVFAIVFGVWASDAGGLRSQLRETMLDRLLPVVVPPSPARSAVTIVDIDRAALARFGPWPWSRGTLASIVAAIAQGRPAAIGIDILLAGSDRFSTDGDERLAGAMGPVPVVLGFVLDSAAQRGTAPGSSAPGSSAPGSSALGSTAPVSPASGRQPVPATPVLARAPAALPEIWRSAGVIGPAPVLSDAAAGFGTLAAAADPDGTIRRVPLLVIAGGAARDSLAVETVLRARQGSTLLIEPGEHPSHRRQDGATRIGCAASPDPAAGRWAARTDSSRPTCSIFRTGGRHSPARSCCWGAARRNWAACGSLPATRHPIGAPARRGGCRNPARRLAGATVLGRHSRTGRCPSAGRHGPGPCRHIASVARLRARSGSGGCLGRGCGGGGKRSWNGARSGRSAGPCCTGFRCGRAGPLHP